METQITLETNYSGVIRNVSDQAYRKVSEFVWAELNVVSSFDGGYTFYTLNKDGEQVIRMHSKRRSIEISDKVNLEIVGAIRYIARTEIRGSDSLTQKQK